YLITDADHQRRKLRLDTNYSEQTLRSALAIIGALAVFIFTFYYMNVPRALFDGRRPLVENTDFLGITMPLHVLRGIILGAILGGLNSGLIGTHASFPLGMAVYNTTRTILNATRSIEPLIM